MASYTLAVCISEFLFFFLHAFGRGGFSGFVYACSKHGDDSQTFAAKAGDLREGSLELFASHFCSLGVC